MYIVVCTCVVRSGADEEGALYPSLKGGIKPEKKKMKQWEYVHPKGKIFSSFPSACKTNNCRGRGIPPQSGQTAGEVLATLLRYLYPLCEVLVMCSKQLASINLLLTVHCFRGYICQYQKPHN